MNAFTANESPTVIEHDLLDQLHERENTLAAVSASLREELQRNATLAQQVTHFRASLYTRTLQLLAMSAIATALALFVLQLD